MICAKEASCAFWTKLEKADSPWCLLAIPDRVKVDERGCEYYKPKGTSKEELLEVAGACLDWMCNLANFKPTIMDRLFRPDKVARFEAAKEYLAKTRELYFAIYKNEIARLPW